MTKKKKRLRWRREPRETGLRGVVQGTRGHELRYGGETIATVSARCGATRYDVIGWYWYARNDELGIPLLNTAARGDYYDSDTDAKVAAKAYVEKHLIRKPHDQS